MARTPDFHCKYAPGHYDITPAATLRAASMKVIADSQCALFCKEGHPETPERVVRSVELLRGQAAVSSWGLPSEVPEAALLRAHDATLLDRLERKGDFDSDTPFYPGIYQAARRAAGGAIAALDAVCAGETAFSLMRPPGHHASRTGASGFCYLNSIAIAAMEAQTRGFQRVAVLDFDVHHGNGTEDILLDKPGFAFASVHAEGYPHTGTKHRGSNCFNFCMRDDTPREEYKQALLNSLDSLRQFKPALLAVSAGFDAYREDPLSEQHLEIEDYYWLGAMVRELDIPTFSILEGGYSPALPQLIHAYLRGLSGGGKTAAA